MKSYMKSKLLIKSYVTEQQFNEIISAAEFEGRSVSNFVANAAHKRALDPINFWGKRRSEIVRTNGPEKVHSDPLWVWL